MQSRDGFYFSSFNFGNETPLVITQEGGTPSAPNNFKLLNGNDFLLLSGDFFLLLGS